MKSSAAVFHAPGQPLAMQEFLLPELGRAEVLVRIRCATICGSDLHSITGRRSCPAPSVLGHEMVGDVVALPDGESVCDFHGHPLAVGDRVTWSMVWNCGVCYYCLRGLASQCEHLFKFGHERTGAGHDLSGAYAEHCLLPAGTAIFRVPASVPDVVAAPANCATATVAAVLRHAGALSGQHVAVIGTGMLGLTACAMAREAGAAQVLAVEPDVERRKQAARFGATWAAEPGPDLRAAILAATEARGADIAFELAGSAEATESAIEYLRPGGHLLLAGAVFPSRPLQLPAERLVRRMIRLTGVYNYTPQDLGTALQFLAGNVSRYPFHELVGARFALSDINTAVAYAESERPPRVAVVPL